MRIIIGVAVLLSCSAAFAFPQAHRHKAPKYKSAYSSPVHVKAHVTKAGTYVAPSYRTAPNHTKADNWSSKPNVNPHNGKVGKKNPYKSPAWGH